MLQQSSDQSIHYSIHSSIKLITQYIQIFIPDHKVQNEECQKNENILPRILNNYSLTIHAVLCTILLPHQCKALNVKNQSSYSSKYNYVMC